MGATEFTTQVYRTTTMASAYRAAVEEATHEYGYDGYNGTISTTSGVRSVVNRPMTEQGAKLYAAVHDDGQKWESALGIPVADDKNFTFKKIKITVSLDPSEEEFSFSPKYALQDKARKMAFRTYGEKVHAVDVTPKVKTKTVVTSATGKSVLRYRVGAGYRSALFDTKAKAVAAAKKEVADGRGVASIQAVRVYPDSDFDDPTTVAEVREITVSATANVVVTIAEPKKWDTPTAGWMFYGLAAC
jgi:hypothetical protein